MRGGASQPAVEAGGTAVFPGKVEEEKLMALVYEVSTVPKEEVLAVIAQTRRRLIEEVFQLPCRWSYWEHRNRNQAGAKPREPSAGSWFTVLRSNQLTSRGLPLTSSPMREGVLR